MPNMSLKKNEMPAQAPDVRNKNFKEVAPATLPKPPWTRPSVA